MLESDQGLLYCISTIVSVPIMVVSPGSGKASLILRTVEGLKGSLRLGIIEGWIDWLKGEVAAFKGLK
jgi:Ni2+-binding GTPase involved in maturation of urease and hydrogenase